MAFHSQDISADTKFVEIEMENQDDSSDEEDILETMFGPRDLSDSKMETPREALIHEDNEDAIICTIDIRIVGLFIVLFCLMIGFRIYQKTRSTDQ